MNINAEIAKNYIVSNKRLTFVAVTGVILGMSIYIFMNSLLVGFDRSSSASIFKNAAHIRVYKDDEISRSLVQDEAEKYLVVNPKIIPRKNTLINPQLIMASIKNLKEVILVSPQVITPVFFNNGKSQLAGSSVGIIPQTADLMFSIKSTMVEGDFRT